MNFDCPLPAALTAVSDPTCPFRFDQIVRMLFQRRQSAAPFASSAAMKVLANWTALIAASGSTKIVKSPIFTGFVIPSSEPLTAGGNDNSTFNGIPDYFGEGSVTATGRFKNLESTIKMELQKLTQESLAGAVGTTNLTVYFVNKDGVIFYTDSPLAQGGIPIYNYRIGSTGSEGFNSHNLTPFGLALPENWDSNLKQVVPSFDPLTAL